MVSGAKKVSRFAMLVTLAALAGTNASASHGSHHHRWSARFHSYRTYAYSRAVSVIQCVAFAKEDAGIEISGNARDWWNNAAGVYERGSRPENGSVLSFMANARMPLGHVAVVSNIQDSRTIVIDQSHWNSRGISRNIEVKDVSDDNDWSAVRVELSHGGSFGSIYPTHGFIYPRPDQGRMVVNTSRSPRTMMNAASEDLRDIGQRRRADLEVAELPNTGRSLDLTVSGLSFDAPNRALR